MFQRTRVIIQVLVTLVSFFGFNEAVLAVRYRNTLYISNYDVRMTLPESAEAAPFLAGLCRFWGYPGNLKFNESPLKLAEFALRDLIQNSRPLSGEKTVDLVIGIAGYDFFHNLSDGGQKLLERQVK
ncbi:MAG: hypothetical protein ACR2PT_16810 [Endozoicomonas sp.]